MEPLETIAGLFVEVGGLSANCTLSPTQKWFWEIPASSIVVWLTVTGLDNRCHSLCLFGDARFLQVTIGSLRKGLWGAFGWPHGELQAALTGWGSRVIPGSQTHTFGMLIDTVVQLPGCALGTFLQQCGDGSFKDYLKSLGM